MNVIDQFKGLSNQEIRDILSKKRRPFSIMLLNLKYDINFGAMIRTNNALCGSEIYMVGSKKFDRRGSVGTHHYEDIRYITPRIDGTYDFDKDKAIEEIAKLNRPIIGVDLVDGAVPINEFEWPENPIIAFGNEGDGINVLPGFRDLCASTVYVPQAGSVRSMNVAVVAGMLCFDFITKRHLW